MERVKGNVPFPDKSLKIEHPPIGSADQLPPNIQAMIGQDCDCCDECPPDPRISCQYDGSPPTYVRTSYVQNARKGDLILVPGGGSGVIGGLLHSLTPPQHYSHMGMMTRNFYWVRHSCGIDDRLTADEYATGSVFGTPAPLDGFTPDHVRYAWPGTVTQTVDQAYLAYVPVDPNPGGPSLAAFRNCSFVDQESGKTPKTTYNINALSFEPIFDPAADTSVFKGDPSMGLPPGTVFPLVVKPCGLLETDAVRQTLWQVADAAMCIFGHYRFYGYTAAASALNPPNAIGPPVRMTNPDPVAAFPDSPDPWFPADPASPQPTTVPVAYTFPTVCSSFAWLAVQAVSLPHFPDPSPSSPSIVLDPSNVDPPLDRRRPIPKCQDELSPDWTGDVAGSRDDGLYLYDNTNRQKAAQWLNNAVKQKVIDKVQQVLPGPLLTLVQTFGITAVVAAAEAGGPPGVAALLLVDQATGANLYEALFEMPNKVANQMCNAFASDYCDESATVSDNWQNPGSVSPDHLHITPDAGSAVSPDNTMFWYPPMGTLALPNGPTQTWGLYGHNEKMILRTGTFAKYGCTWQLSNGTCTLQGFVKHGGVGVNGAVVYVGCKETITHSSGGDRPADGFFSLEIPQGRYLAKATATGTNGWGLDGQCDTGVIPTDAVQAIEIDLQDPPPERRIITVTGSMLLTDYYLGFSSPDQKLYLFNTPPLRAEVVIEGTQSSDIHNNVVVGYTKDNEDMSDIGDDTSATLEIWIDAINYNHDDPTDSSNLSVDGHWIYSLPDDKQSSSPVPFHIDKDGSYTGTSFLDTGGTFPDSAKLSFTMNNVRAP